MTERAASLRNTNPIYPRAKADNPRHRLFGPGPRDWEKEGELEQVAAWGTKPHAVGICLSGGGIRSAAFCLGALQTFENEDLLFGDRRADYLSAVSGGSYIATAFTMVTKGKIGAVHDDPATAPTRDGSTLSPDMRPFAHGTPEEQLLRHRTLYLTHGRGGIPAVVWRVFLGVLFNVTIVTLTLAAVSIPLGWLYAWAWPVLRAGCPKSCPTTTTFAIPTWLWVLVVVMAGLSIISGFVWLAWRFRSSTARTAVGQASGILLGLALFVALFFVGIPYLIHLARPVYMTGGLPQAAQTTSTTTKAVASLGLIGLVAAWIAAARRLVAQPSSVQSGVWNWIKEWATKHRSILLNVGATIAGPLLVLAGIVMLSFWSSGALPSLSGRGLWEWVTWLVGLLVLIGLWFRADVTAWSLYPVYRNRLSAGFVVRRIPKGPAMSPTAVDGEDADERPYEESYRLTQCQPSDFPELIVCAAANVSDYGATPSGSNVTSFTFSAKQIGGPLVGAQPTTLYEEALGDGGVRSSAQARFTTLPTAMAISGAAIAPSMGKMTRVPLRFFMALANLRLGVWVPNPRHLDLFNGRSALHQVLPRPHYFVREMLGKNSIDDPFLYITDGGHYENLGLVELLRRKCKTIWCIDAAGDQVNTFTTLGGALQTAQGELQITVDIEPEKEIAPAEKTRPDTGIWFVKKPYCKGTIKYPDGTEGTIAFVKAGVPDNAPWSVLSFANQHPQFPCDPTLDQLYDADRFDAYRELGAFCVKEAIDNLAV